MAWGAPGGRRLLLTSAQQTGQTADSRQQTGTDSRQQTGTDSRREENTRTDRPFPMALLPLACFAPGRLLSAVCPVDWTAVNRVPPAARLRGLSTSSQSIEHIPEAHRPPPHPNDRAPVSQTGSEPAAAPPVCAAAGTLNC